jgi:N-hydroxyarylamine O-acetyltransferase
MSDALDLDAYFARIGYAGAREPTLAVLQGLHARHPRAIPFENLDPLQGRTPKLDLASLQAKLVTGRRGGYCFEHNALFAAVLRALGFEVTPLAARVLWNRPETPAAPPRTHMLLRVETEAGPHIADVGFGGMVKTQALRLDPNAEQDTGHGVFRLVPLGDEALRLEARLPERWSPMYQFDEAPQAPVDYELANWFVATHPASPFTDNLMAAWVTDDRRYAVLDNRVAVHHLGGKTEKHVLDAAGLEALMHETFGIARPEGIEAVYARLAARG